MALRLKPGARPGRLGPVALMPAAGITVHQLRYWLAFHGGAALELRRQGHAYLHSLTPWIVLLLALALGGFLRSLGRAWGGRCSLRRYTVSFAALWAICSACLVAIFITQELLEALTLSRHPGGLTGVFGYGGGWAIPAALGMGLILAAVYHGTHWVLHQIAERRVRHAARPKRRAAVLRLPGVAPTVRLAPLADGWSGRGPPQSR